MALVTRPGELQKLASRVETETKQRLARELHDSIVQSLTVMVVDMELFKREAADQPQVVSRVEGLQGEARQALQSLRQVLYDLREQPATETSFVPRVRSLLDRLESSAGIRSRLTVSARWPSRLSAATAHQLYRIVEEALNNVRLHSGAGRVSVELDGGRDGVTVTIQDDGRGMPETVPAGMGMIGMRERAALLGGALTVSGGTGRTTVRAVLPGPV